MIRVTLDPRNPPQLTPEACAALDALTPEEIEENAHTDPDNPPLTEEELERLDLARTVQRTRETSGLTQAEFARRYHIDPSRLEDWERGRLRPDPTIMAYLTTIRMEPEAVTRALASRVAA